MTTAQRILQSNRTDVEKRDMCDFLCERFEWTGIRDITYYFPDKSGIKMTLSDDLYFKMEAF